MAGPLGFHTSEYKALCQLLKQLREEAGMTQRELAAEMKIGHTIIAKIEMGERRIDPIEFCRWCRATQVDPAEGVRRIKF